jgi:high affinity sulfate transporter 1
VSGSSRRGIERRLRGLVPAVDVVRGYRRGWLGPDVLAGTVLVALLVPQGMAYAELAGLPAVTGLYATLVPLVAYAIFGPSRILVLAPDSAIAPLVAAAIIPIAGADMSERLALAGLLAILVGLFCLAGGLARLGFLTDLLSKPVRVGFLAGIALVVVVDQLPKLLGIDSEHDDLASSVAHLARSLDETDLTTALIGLSSLAAILAFRFLAPRVPGTLVVVVAATAVVSAFGLDVQTVGVVPEGLPTPTVPRPDLDELGSLVLAALAIALVAFADTSVLSRSYAAKLGERVDQDQELRALGFANLATGFLQGFPISSSSSRTAAAEAARARTQLAGLVAALGLALVLLFATGLFDSLPTATLAAVVIAAVVFIVDLPALRTLARVNRADFALAIASFLGVALIGVVQGVAIAVGLSVLAVLWRAWHPYDAVLGRVAGLKGYHDTERHPEGRQVPGLVLYRFDAPLFFANADAFRRRVLRAAREARPPARRVVVAAEPITDVDSTAADVLAELDAQLEQLGVELAFAEMKGPVKDKLRRYGLFERIGEERFYPTVGSAVHAYVEETRVDWHDWEDERPAR